VFSFCFYGYFCAVLKGLPAFKMTNMGMKMYVLVFALQGGVPASQHERGSVVYHQLRAHNHNRVCKSDRKHTPRQTTIYKMEINFEICLRLQIKVLIND